jgi:hypothetical protein
LEWSEKLALSNDRSKKVDNQYPAYDITPLAFSVKIRVARFNSMFFANFNKYTFVKYPWVECYGVLFHEIDPETNLMNDFQILTGQYSQRGLSNVAVYILQFQFSPQIRCVVYW